MLEGLSAFTLFQDAETILSQGLIELSFEISTRGFIETVLGKASISIGYLTKWTHHLHATDKHDLYTCHNSYTADSNNRRETVFMDFITINILVILM